MNSCMDPCIQSAPNCGCESQPMTVTMDARITRVCPGRLLVCDLATGQTVQVTTDQACDFQVCECIRIKYNGVMTTSIPPQINADSICRISCC